jgi:hypothetical protein
MVLGQGLELFINLYDGPVAQLDHHTEKLLVLFLAESDLTSD